jgi:hypothetical protein
MAGSTIASDVANPAFAGAVNGDERLVARFYTKPVHNEWKSGIEGRPIYEPKDFIEIWIPGDQTLKIDVPAREDHRRRFPQQWAHFQNTRDGSELAMGTPVTQWPFISASQAEELKAMKFYTVEQIATASDQQIGRIGMAGGMQPFAFRDRAKAFLDAAKDTALVQHQAAELAKRDEEIKRIKEESERRMVDLQAQILALTEAVTNKQQPKMKAA